MRLVRSVKAAFAAVSAVLMAGGLCLLVWPEVSATVLCAALGIAALLYGAVRLVGYFSRDLYRLAFQFDLAVGILSIVVGLVLLLRTGAVLAHLPAGLGLFILADCVLRLQTALDARRFGMRRWWMLLAAAICGGAVGALLLLRPFEGGMALVRLMGAALLLYGAENLLVGLYTVRVPGPGGVIDVDYTVEDD